MNNMVRVKVPTGRQATDLEWIRQHGRAVWQVATEGYSAQGRGMVLVSNDGTLRYHTPPAVLSVPERRILERYDPAHEVVVLKGEPVGRFYCVRIDGV